MAESLRFLIKVRPPKLAGPTEAVKGVADAHTVEIPAAERFKQGDI